MASKVVFKDCKIVSAQSGECWVLASTRANTPIVVDIVSDRENVGQWEVHKEETSSDYLYYFKKEDKYITHSSKDLGLLTLTSSEMDASRFTPTVSAFETISLHKISSKFEEAPVYFKLVGSNTHGDGSRFIGVDHFLGKRVLKLLNGKHAVQWSIHHASVEIDNDKEMKIVDVEKSIEVILKPLAEPSLC